MLLDRVPELELAVSATTRARRPGEENGREYYFIDREEFDRRLAADEFLEWVEWPWGEHKRAGTLWSEIERITGEGRPVLLELETGGALAVRDRIPGSITIFITAPNREELERRLRARGTESEGEIEERLAQALEQSKLAGELHGRQRPVGACNRRARGHRPKGNCRLARLKIKTIVPPNTGVYTAARAKPARPLERHRKRCLGPQVLSPNHDPSPHR